MNTIKQLNDVARFSHEDIAAFTSSDLMILRTYSPISKGNSTRVNQLVADKKLHPRLNSKEYEIVNKAISSKEEGTEFFGVSIEDRAYPAGTSVKWGPKVITLETNSGTIETIPNVPLIPTKPLTKHGSARLALFVCSLFDISKGILTPVRDATIDNDIFKDASCVYNPSGVPAFMAAIEESFNKYKLLARVLEEKKTIKSHAMTDFVFAWINKIDMDEYLAINHLLQHHLWRNMKVDGKGVILTKTVTSEVNGIVQVDKLVPATAWKLYPAASLTREPAPEFNKLGIFPMIMDTPFAPRQKWSRPYDTALAMCSDFKKSMTLRGGNKRGIGKISTYMDYCARQGKTIRRANFFIWALLQLPSGIAGDVHVDPGDVALISTWVKERRILSQFVNVNLVLAEKDMKGVKPETFIQVSSRSDAVQIKIMDWISVPDCTNSLKTREAGLANIDSMYTKFLSGIKGKFIVLAPRFSEKQASNSWPIGKGHDLQAVHSNMLDTISGLREEYEKPMSWKDWMERCRMAFRDVNGWMLCAGPIYNLLGTYYTPPKKPLSIIDGNWVVPTYETDEVIVALHSDWVQADGVASESVEVVTTVTTTNATTTTMTTGVASTEKNSNNSSANEEYVTANSDDDQYHDGRDTDDDNNDEIV